MREECLELGSDVCTKDLYSNRFDHYKKYDLCIYVLNLASVIAFIYSEWNYQQWRSVQLFSIAEPINQRKGNCCA